MANYRSAMGKSVDMSAIVSKNENTRAVGNMKVNARGDTIDATGKIIQSVTDKVNKAYSKTVGTRSSHSVGQTRTKPAPKVQADVVKPDPIQPKIEVAELTQEELDLERELDDDEIVEQLKAMEANLPKAKK